MFVATGSARVAGAREAVQASYGAAAREPGRRTEAEGQRTEDEGRRIEDEGWEIALTPTASCCSGPAVSCCMPAANAMPEVAGAPPADVVLFEAGYATEHLASLPDEAAELVLGCGNPAALAALRPGETVLDIGSGAGGDAFTAARQVEPAGRVIGIDMTPDMLARARGAAARAGYANVEFRQGQAEQMPVGDATVDVVLSNCVINLCEDKGRVFEEAYRVLKPGGRLAISDMVTDGALPRRLRADPERWAGCVQGALPEQEYLALIAEAGFTDVVGRRSLSGGAAAGVPVYSLSVTARRP